LAGKGILRYFCRNCRIKIDASAASSAPALAGRGYALVSGRRGYVFKSGVSLKTWLF